MSQYAGYGYQQPSSQTYYGHEQPMSYGDERIAPPPQGSQGWHDQQQQSQQFQQQSSAGYQELPVQQHSAAESVEVVSIKEIERSAMFTFCPSGPFLAAGSVAGAIDLSFSTSSQLEVRFSGISC